MLVDRATRDVVAAEVALAEPATTATAAQVSGKRYVGQLNMRQLILLQP